MSVKGNAKQGFREKYFFFRVVDIIFEEILKNMELTTEQKARVFAQYIGCEISLEFTREWRPYQGRLCGVIKNETCIIDVKTAHDTCAHNSRVRVYLRPLSALTDEDAVEFAQNFSAAYDPAEMVDLTIYEKAHWLKHEGRKTVLEMLHHQGRYNAFAFQYLTQKGYAVPLFIAPGHPDNGKTAIEMGLAIDITTVK